MSLPFVIELLIVDRSSQYNLFVLTSYCRELGLCRFAAVIKIFGTSLVQDPWIIVRTDVPEIQYRTLLCGSIVRDVGSCRLVYMVALV